MCLFHAIKKNVNQKNMADYIKLLKNAINFHDVDRVKELLPHVSPFTFINCDLSFPYRISPLHYVVHCGNYAILNLMLEYYGVKTCMRSLRTKLGEMIVRQLYDIFYFETCPFFRMYDDLVMLDRLQMMHEVLKYELKMEVICLRMISLYYDRAKYLSSNCSTHIVHLTYLTLYAIQDLQEFFYDPEKRITNFEMLMMSECKNEVVDIAGCWINLKFFYCLQCKNVPLYLLL
jgi:hypothetical protein